MEWTACFFDIDIDQFDYLEKLLKEKTSKYVVAYESEPKSHYHMLFFANPGTYEKISRHLVEKFDLRRKKHGGVIKYGKVKQIKDKERMLSYTIKDHNFRTNLEEEEIESAIESSFTKTKGYKEIKDKIVQYLDQIEVPVTEWYYIDNRHKICRPTNFRRYIQKHIIQFYLDQNINMKSITTIKSLYIYFIQNSQNLKAEEKIVYLQDLIH